MKARSPEEHTAPVASSQAAPASAAPSHRSAPLSSTTCEGEREERRAYRTAGHAPRASIAGLRMERYTLAASRSSATTRSATNAGVDLPVRVAWSSHLPRPRPNMADIGVHSRTKKVVGHERLAHIHDVKSRTIGVRPDLFHHAPIHPDVAVAWTRRVRLRCTSCQGWTPSDAVERALYRQ